MHGPSHGGSSHISSSGSSGFSSSGGFHYHAPRTIMFFGRPMILTSGMASLLSLLIFFLIAAFSCSLITGMGLAQSNKDIKYMQEDSVEWQEVIDNAKSGQEGYYLITLDNIHFDSYGSGIFRDDYTYDGMRAHGENYDIAYNFCLTYDGTDYFQFFYYFIDPNTGYEVIYRTYAQYKEPANVHSLEFAYKLDSEEDILCINTSYSLNKCMEYHEAQDSAKTQKTVCIISGCIAAALLVGIVVAVVYNIKKTKAQNALNLEKKKAEVEKAQAEADMAKADLKQKHRYCTYCGSPIPEGESQCPACGSRN